MRADAADEGSATSVVGIADGEILDLVKRSPDGLLVLSETGLIDYANDAAVQLLGRAGDDLRGEPFGFPLVEGDEEEIELRRSDGTVVTMLMRVTPVTSLGEKRWVAALHESAPHQVTETTRDEHHALAVTSHELRSPMAALTGYADMLALDWDRLPDDVRLQHVRRIQRLSRRLQLVVSRFLHSAQLEAGLFAPHRSDTHLLDVLLEGIAELGDAAADVDLRVPGGIRVDVHPDHIWSMVSNGILNALRHGAPPVVVAAREEAQWVVVSVVDHGPGVPAEDRERLFERFVRGASQESPGSGLGLWITRSIARAYGGDAWHEGEGPGARFCCRVPAASPQRAEGVDDQPGLPGRQRDHQSQPPA